jgi:hypothetical protein
MALTATAASYIGRQVDLLLYDGMQSQGDALLSPALVQPGDSAGGAEIAGIQKLAQRFLLELFTEAGSMLYLPARGCPFMSQARHGGWRTAADVTLSFYSSLLYIARNLTGEELPTDPPDECYGSATLTSVTVNTDMVTLRLTLYSQAGTSRVVLFPLRVNAV